jgi:hypothetical protein
MNCLKSTLFKKLIELKVVKNLLHTLRKSAEAQIVVLENCARASGPYHSFLDGHGAERRTWKMLKTKQNCKSKTACQVKTEATIADPKDAPTTLPTNCTRIKQKMMS